jgi:anti-sigma regulatory factor (Ser/Thr protein kinase)
MLRCQYTWPATAEHIRDARSCVAELAARAGAPAHCGPAPRTDSPGAGLGLPLIAEVAESMSVSRGRDGHGTVLSMTFELPFARTG